MAPFYHFSISAESGQLAEPDDTAGSRTSLTASGVDVILAPLVAVVNLRLRVRPEQRKAGTKVNENQPDDAASNESPRGLVALNAELTALEGKTDPASRERFAELLDELLNLDMAMGAVRRAMGRAHEEEREQGAAAKRG